MRIEPNQKVIEKIKELRRQKNISQNFVAQKLGLSVSAYNRIENNKTHLTINNLYAIAAALEIGVEDLSELNLHNTANNFNNGKLQISINAEELKNLK